MKKIFAVSLLALVLLAGCSQLFNPDSPAESSKNESPPEASQTPPEAPSSSPDPTTPDGTAELLLQKLSDLNEDSIKELVGEYLSAESIEQLPDSCYSILVPISKRVSYKVGNCKIDGDKAAVDVSITSVDAKKALNSIMPRAVAHLAALQISGKDISNPEKILSEYIAQNIDWNTLQTVKTDSTLYLLKGADGEWKIDASNPDNIGFANAISGGAIDLVQDLKSFAENFQ